VDSAAPANGKREVRMIGRRFIPGHAELAVGKIVALRVPQVLGAFASRLRALSWPTTATIHGPCKHGWGIGISSIPFATRSLRQIASRTSGVESFSTLAARKRGFEAFPHQMDGGSVPLFWVVVQKLERDSNGLFSQPAWIGRRTDQP